MIDDMANTIAACKRAEAKLIFFDNVYMYGKVAGPMTENTPYAPCSKKGEIRAKIASALLNEVQGGRLSAMNSGKLARTPPHTMFYAPFLTNANIGGVPGKTAFVDRPGPHGMIIVLAGEKEREALMSESQSLVDEVERQIGLK
jgi:hypothetical protein